MPSSLKARVEWRKNRSSYDFTVVVKGFPTQIQVKLPTKKRRQEEMGEFGSILTEEVEVIFYRFHNTMTHEETRTLTALLQQAAAEIASREAEFKDKDYEYVP